jgi:hypothetical protein
MAMQRAVNSSYVGSTPTWAAMKYKVEIGTMLYDYGANLIGWVTGKHVWRGLGDNQHDDWDVEWADGTKYYDSENGLKYYIKGYIVLKQKIDREK